MERECHDQNSCPMSVPISSIEKHDETKTSHNISSAFKGEDFVDCKQFDEGHALSKETDSEKKPEEVENDEYISSLLSVHFGDSDSELNKGRQKIEGILNKLYNKHRMGDSTHSAKKTEGETKCRSHGLDEMGSSAPYNENLTTTVMTSTVTISNTIRGWSGKPSIEASQTVNPPVSKSYVSMFPKVRRERKRPPPKTSTVYNAELTTIATADQICLNIRLKERKEKHERWKKFPHEKTKYRTKSTWKAKAEIQVTKGNKKEGKVKQQQIKGEEEIESLNASSSNNSNGPEGVHRCHCQFCGMGFAHKSRLTLHERCHTGEKPYPCPFCDKAFSQNGYLKTHLKIHTGEKPFQCSICDYSFRLSTTLNRHMRVHTGECPYTCHVCSKSFNQKSTLSKHLKTHSKDKPHVCGVCNKGFKLIDTLRVHQQIHEGIKPFICSICEKAFRTKGTLLSHIKTHTRNLKLLDNEKGSAILMKEVVCENEAVMKEETETMTTLDFKEDFSNYYVQME